MLNRTQTSWCPGLTSYLWMQMRSRENGYVCSQYVKGCLLSCTVIGNGEGLFGKAQNCLFWKLRWGHQYIRQDTEITHNSVSRDPADEISLCNGALTWTKAEPFTLRGNFPIELPIYGGNNVALDKYLVTSVVKHFLKDAMKQMTLK